MGEEFLDHDDSVDHDDGKICCGNCQKGIEAGRRELLNESDAQEILNALATSVQDPGSALSRALTEKLSKRAPVAPIPQSKKRAVPHRFEFKCSGRKGDVLEVEVISPYRFRGEKLICIESAVGSTRIKALEVAGKSQLPTFQGPISSAKAFPNNSLDCGIMFDTVDPGGVIKFEVIFDEDCDWIACLFGRKVVES